MPEFILRGFVWRVLRTSGLLLAVAALGLTAACRAPKCVVDIDPRFSINVVKVPPCYPPKDVKPPLSPAQTEAIERRGRPEFIRFWWTRDGSFVTSSDFSGKGDKQKEMLEEAKTSWIYLDEDLELEFRNGGTQSFEHPLTDKLRLICEFGDPDVKTPPKTDVGGHDRETWRWIDRGLEVELLDGHEVHRHRFTGTGAGTSLFK